MIYLIGGPPRCGKTTVAKRLANLLRCSMISGDWLEGIASRYVGRDIKPQLFPKNRVRRETNYSNDQMYSQYSAEEIVALYRQQAATTGAAIGELARRAASSNTDFIIEGFQVEPRLMQKLRDQLGSEVVRPLLLLRDDYDGALEDCRACRAENDWFRDKTASLATHQWIIHMITFYGTELYNDAAELGIPAHFMDGGFWEHVDAAVDLLQGIVRDEE